MRKGMVAWISAALSGFVMTGLAWACSAQSSLFLSSATSGPAGSRVTLKGEAIPSGETVEIRWNSLQGRKLGSAVPDSRGDFAVEVVVPGAPVGIHYIVAVGATAEKSRAGDPGTAFAARTAFEVTPGSLAGGKTGASSRTISTDLWGEFDPTQGGSQAVNALHNGQTGTSGGQAAGFALLATGALGAAASLIGILKRPRGGIAQESESGKATNL